MKAILIDDEPNSLKALKAEIEAFCPEVQVVQMCQSAVEGMDALRQKKPDLVFLDIEMPEMNGFEMLKNIDRIDFHVIFVTAYDQYAVRAFEFNAVDYLLKPVLKEKLIAAVEKVQANQQSQIDLDSLDALINNISAQIGTGWKNIALPTTEGFEFVELDDIIYIKAESNYCWIFLRDNSKHFLAKTLKQLEQLIRGNQFFRPHQSFLINMNFAKKYIRGKSGYIQLKDGTQIPVARTRKEELLEMLRS